MGTCGFVDVLCFSRYCETAEQREDAFNQAASELEGSWQWDRSRLNLWVFLLWASSRSELHWCSDTLVTPRLHANMELLMISSTPDLESSSLSYVHNLYKLCIAVQWQIETLVPRLALSCPRHLEQLSSRAHMPQRGIKTYCRPKIAPRAHFLDAEGHAANCKLDCFCFGCDVRLSCVL